MKSSTLDSVGLDTSVLLRLLIGLPETQAEVALKHIQKIRARQGLVYISDLVISEAYFALQHHYGLTKAESLKTIATLADDPLIHLSPGLRETLKTKRLATAKPGFIDRLIHSEYQQQSLPLFTFEKSASRLPETIVLNAK